MLVDVPLQPTLLKIAPNFDRQLRRVCEGIIAGAREGKATSPAAEWLLGNYTYLRTQIREVRESLPRGFYRRLPRDEQQNRPRIFGVMEQAISAHGDALGPDTLLAFFEQWQQHTILNLSELWAIRPMLKIALFKELAAGLSSYPLESPDLETVVRRAITILRGLDDVTWPEFVESLCLIDRILRADPGGAYPQMDFDTRDRYRRSVEEIARLSRSTEQDVARAAIRLSGEKSIHVGFYLVGKGLPELRRAVHSRRTLSQFVRDVVWTVPNLIYIGGTLVLTVALLWLARIVLPESVANWFLLFLILPASQAALTIINLLVSYFLPPQVRPRMDFRNGIPDESRSIVVVPTLLLSKAGIQQLINNLEIYYLANRDRNLFFALLTDLPDAVEQPQEDASHEDPLVTFCAAGVRELNRRYRSENREPFFLFHRNREWNASEGKWMGRERKRGKLDDFNRLLLGHDNPFSRTVGSLEQIGNTRYVITLDSDTQLPRDTAWKLIATMAHPLNRPVFDDRRNIVREGYALMQPRIGISMESAGKSRFSALYSGQVGFDPYTKAVSDVYQDLFGRATFTGKGIYDVTAFDRATKGRFPDNTLLSHDLIEGEHVRAGLVTDLEMIDDYPSRYQAFSKRKHRWVRGDWQIAMWLLPRVPNAAWKWVPNALPVVSRWKIFDNLRRSLVEPSYFLAFLFAWFFLGADAGAATLITAAFLLIPVYAELPISLLRLPPVRFFQAWLWTRFSDFVRAHVEAVLTLIFLPAQALLMFDAVVRTIFRRISSRRHLLEWESMAQAEMSKESRFEAADLIDPARVLSFFRSWNMPERYLAISVVMAIALWLVLAAFTQASDDYPAFVLLLAWIGSPAVVAWLNTTPKRSGRHSEENAFLRSVALSTWRYFLDHEIAEDHWLVPDNVQEDPPAIAHRTSPTNVGLQLNATLAAHEFGYITHRQFAARLTRLGGTLAQMERDRGHFFNWYDTRTLSVLPPRFLSSVDSGNLMASLIVTRQGCAAVLKQPLIGCNTFEALRDKLAQLRQSIPVSARNPSIFKLVDNLNRQLASEPDDLFFWEGVLTEVRSVAQELQEQIRWTAKRLDARVPHLAEEIHYWLAQFQDGVQEALDSLCELAPWLCGAFETELRFNLNNPHLSALMGLLKPVAQVGRMGALYTAIDAEIQRLASGGGPVHGSTLAILNNLQTALRGARERWRALDLEFRTQSKFLGELSRDMDFKFLVDERRHLLSIGWDSEAGKLAGSFYDLLASEARTAVFVAIARGDAPLEAWFHLGRKLTYYRGHRTLLSWSGTMFEYLMPALFMQTWDGTLLGESLRSVIAIQRLYARERRIPWGISESAHSERDVALNYQYRAFGVPCCGADRILPDDLVVAPYASVLALMIDPVPAVENLRLMASRGWLARYGFYEAIDFRRGGRVQRKTEVIRAFMAHHQGMSFLALANVLLDNPIQKLFHADPTVMATELLLQERMPTMADAKAPEEPFSGLSPEATGIADDLVARAST